MSYESGGGDESRNVHSEEVWKSKKRKKKSNYNKLKLPAASAINSLVQSASAASPRAMSPGVEAESEPARNSAAQSPERANAATSGAMTST